MNTIASQITSLTIVYLTVNSGTDQRKHQSSASLAFVRGIHRRPVNSPHKGPVTRKMFPFDDVIMDRCNWSPGASWEMANIDSGNGLAPVRRQAITWTNAEELEIDVSIEIQTFFSKLHLHLSSAKRWPFPSSILGIEWVPQGQKRNPEVYEWNRSTKHDKSRPCAYYLGYCTELHCPIHIYTVHRWYVTDHIWGHVIWYNQVM